MHAPSASGPCVQDAAVVTTAHRTHILTHTDMVANASTRHPGAADGPSILRVVPLLRVSGKKGQRVIQVGHSCLSIQDVDHVAVESFVTNAWVEGSDEGEFVRVTVDEANMSEKVKAATAEFERELPAWPDAASPKDRQMQIAKHS